MDSKSPFQTNMCNLTASISTFVCEKCESLRDILALSLRTHPADSSWILLRRQLLVDQAVTLCMTHICVHHIFGLNLRLLINLPCNKLPDLILCCLLALTCSSSRCPCGEFCTNKRFERHANADVDIFLTEKKGHGLMAKAAIAKLVL